MEKIRFYEDSLHNLILVLPVNQHVSFENTCGVGTEMRLVVYGLTLADIEIVSSAHLAESEAMA